MHYSYITTLGLILYFNFILILYFLFPKSHKQTPYNNLDIGKRELKIQINQIPINNHQPRTNTTPIVQKLIQTKQINLHCHQLTKHVDLDRQFLMEKKDRVRSEEKLHHFAPDHQHPRTTQPMWIGLRERERMN